MATAGMRLLTKKQNNDIWKNICKTEFNGYQFASIKSKKCGTIPGTQEAFYEWLANIAENSEIKNRDQSFEQITGTFTVGGASAQIAVPLLSTKMVESWEEMIEKIETRFGNCKDIMLPGGEHPIPIFSDVVNGVSCARDFIDIKTTEEIKDSLCEDVQEYTNLSEMKGLGLVSFLGLSGQGGDIESGVAGGAEKITTWAEHVSCDPTESSGSTAKYEICKNRLKVALNTDPLFAEVKEFFHEHNLNVKHFNFNTPGATPSGAFNKEHADGLMKLKISIPLTKNNRRMANKEIENIKELEKTQKGPHKHNRLQSPQTLAFQLEKWCSQPGPTNANFGFNGKNNCMRATFTSLFGKCFFISCFHSFYIFTSSNLTSFISFFSCFHSFYIFTHLI